MKEMTNYEHGLYQALQWMIREAEVDINYCEGEDAERRATEALNVASSFLYDYWYGNEEIYNSQSLIIESLRDKLRAKIATRNQE